MVLVTSYSHLQKQDPKTEAFRTFTALRAAGLSLERAWKLSRDKGLGAVTAEDVKLVEVVGTLRLRTGERWRNAGRCTLELKDAEANLVTTLLRKQRALLSDLGFNVWKVDAKEPGSQKPLDLVGDFNTAKNFGVGGRVWVELKVYSDSSFDKEVAQTKEELAEILSAKHVRDPTLQAVFLLVGRVSKASGCQWGAPSLHGMLLVAGSQDWITVAGGRRAARGQVQGSKPPLTKVWSKMEWYQTTNGTKVGMLHHFLDVVDVDCTHTGDRAATYNKMLRQKGKSGRVEEQKLANRPGKSPWVATKDTFRAIYEICL